MHHIVLLTAPCGASQGAGVAPETLPEPDPFPQASCARPHEFLSSLLRVYDGGYRAGVTPIPIGVYLPPVWRDALPAFSVLVVEDEKLLSKEVQDILRRMEYEVKGTASTGEEAVRKAGELKPSLVLMDVVLSGVLDGIQAAEQISRLYDIPVVYTTAHADEKTLQRIRQTAPYGCVYKPVRDRELRAAIEFALDRHGLEKQLRESQHWMAATLRSVSEAVIATDPQGRVKFMSGMAEALAEVRQEQVFGHYLTAVLPLRDPIGGGTLENFAARFLKEEGGTVYHRFPMDRAGREASVGCSISPIRDERRALLGFVLVFREAGSKPGAPKP
jgi:two-component system, cell cycle sensor histidine kinase and response regulator CckA